MKRNSKETVFKEDFIPWCKSNGHLPSVCSSDPLEKRLGRWRSKNRKWDVLIEFMSQYEKCVNKSKEQVLKEDFIPWCKSHGCLPSQHSSDSIEKRLGQWRNYYRNWDVLIEFMSRYEKKHKTKEQVFKEDFIPWCKSNGHLPSVCSSDPLEKRLGKWRDKNRKWDVLIEFMSQYEKRIRKSKEQVLKEDLIPWCKSHGHLPSTRSSDPIEKKLGQWRSVNRTWKPLIQFSTLVKYSETNQKARELLEKFMEH